MPDPISLANVALNKCYNILEDGQENYLGKYLGVFNFYLRHGRGDTRRYFFYRGNDNTIVAPPDGDVIGSVRSGRIPEADVRELEKDPYFINERDDYGMNPMLMVNENNPEPLRAGLQPETRMVREVPCPAVKAVRDVGVNSLISQNRHPTQPPSAFTKVLGLEEMNKGIASYLGGKGKGKSKKGKSKKGKSKKGKSKKMKQKK